VEEGLRINVTDTGQGLTEENIAEIFEPFTRLKAEQDGVEGTGVGLAITKLLVEIMGGRLGVESTPGKGSTFWVEFPLASEPSVERVEAEQTASEPISTLEGHILLAEDNQVNQIVALAMLEQYDLEVDVVENGTEALEAYLAKPYDLVLMDCQMPHMDGFEATAEIRRREVAAGAKTSIPIIALTANAMSGAREQCLAAGMSDFVSKPFTVEAITEMLARWLTPVNTPLEVPERKDKGKKSDDAESIGGEEALVEHVSQQ
jgi:CheY-like chemotaxis protein